MVTAASSNPVPTPRRSSWQAPSLASPRSAPGPTPSSSNNAQPGASSATGYVVSRSATVAAVLHRWPLSTST